jgi:hypothetical protein
VIDPAAMYAPDRRTGTLSCHDPYLGGSDNDSTFFNKTLRVQFGVPVFDIQAGKWTVVPGGDLNFVDWADVSCIAGDSNASLHIQVDIWTDYSVDVLFTGHLNDLSWGPTTIHLSKDQMMSVGDANIDEGRLFGDSAKWTGIIISNNPANAI